MRYIIMVLMTINLFAVDATIKIKKDTEQRAKIVLVDSSSGISANISNKFFSIMQSDLKISGHFLANKKHFKESTLNSSISDNLKSKGYILKYKLSTNSGLKIDIILIRSSDGVVITKKDYAISSNNKYPFLAHKIISYINNTLQYPNIDWINRYVVFSRYTSSKKSIIVLADYTMHFKKTVIKGGLNLFPKWADREQKSFYYTSFKGIPTLYKLNIYNGQKTKITTSEGMLVCSDVKDNGSKILVTMAPDAQPDIYEMSSNGGGKRRVTKFSGIDVSGKYINNGNAITFVSNRMGYPNIFKKSINGSAVSQVVYRGRNNNGVDAYKNKIVYSSRESHKKYGQNRFNLYLTHTNDSGTRPLTSNGVNQFPRFSIDGSTILYIKQYQNKSSVGYINLTSNQNLLFPLGGKVQSIDW
ncbi:tolB protein precursor, periplasmic protein involved in the tonb-independent uptake of group A colicins [hydrothermal vent metagenome]|uniref:TolB protein, periplasmic protein involved in the tonb-independent uptake of group A colicins n=1 Tax=hydrothermal vent metagenome TaxID=652676 RepID=A0A1W1BM36_9ZZZZ